MTVHQMGRRTRPLQSLHPHSGAEQSRRFMRDVVKRRRNAGHRVERTGAAMPQDERGKSRDVVDQHVITTLLALAEYLDWATARRLAPEAVRAIAGMRIGGAIDEGRAQ